MRRGHVYKDFLLGLLAISSRVVEEVIEDGGGRFTEH